MPRTHKLVRDACMSVLSAGFNTALAAALPDYGITDSIAIDWANPDNALYAPLQSGEFGISRLRGRLSVAIGPDGSQWTGETRGIKWSGRVGVRIVFRIVCSFREDDDNPLEDDAVTAIATAVEDAVIEVFQAPGINWGALGVVYAKPPDCPEGYVFEMLSDGTETVIPMSVLFKVDAH